MYEFEGEVKTWVCAGGKEQALTMFKDWCGGEEAWEESLRVYGKGAVREMSLDGNFVYYHDGTNEEDKSIGRLIEKYCGKPGMFATSNY